VAKSDQKFKIKPHVYIVATYCYLIAWQHKVQRDCRLCHWWQDFSFSRLFLVGLWCKILLEPSSMMPDIRI